MVDEVNPAVPIARNIPEFLGSRVLKVMQDIVTSAARTAPLPGCKAWT